MSEQKKKTVVTGGSAPQAKPKAAPQPKPKSPASGSLGKSAKIKVSDPLMKTMPFDRKNYLFIIGGVLLVVLGYILLSGEEFVDATEFSIGLYVVPPIMLLGYLVIAFGILRKPEQTTGPEDNATAL
jgi:Protein of unknown function (DUF3098).